MRVFSDGERICHNTRLQHGLKLSVRVVEMSGKVRLDLKEDRLECPNENGELYASDVLGFIGIGKDEKSLFDIVCSEPARNAQPQFVEVFDQVVHFGKVYILVKRYCARCTMCSACCTRSGKLKVSRSFAKTNVEKTIHDGLTLYQKTLGALVAAACSLGVSCEPLVAASEHSNHSMHSTIQQPYQVCYMSDIVYIYIYIYTYSTNRYSWYKLPKVAMGPIVLQWGQPPYIYM